MHRAAQALKIFNCWNKTLSLQISCGFIPNNPKCSGITDDPKLSIRGRVKVTNSDFPAMFAVKHPKCKKTQKNPNIPQFSVSQPGVVGQSHPVVTPKSPKSNNQPNLAKFSLKAADLFKVFKII